jgi:hypothetical protein
LYSSPLFLARTHLYQLAGILHRGFLLDLTHDLSLGIAVGEGTEATGTEGVHFECELGYMKRSM